MNVEKLIKKLKDYPPETIFEIVADPWSSEEIEFDYHKVTSRGKPLLTLGIKDFHEVSDLEDKANKLERKLNDISIIIRG